MLLFFISLYFNVILVWKSKIVRNMATCSRNCICQHALQAMSVSSDVQNNKRKRENYDDDNMKPKRLKMTLPSE